MESWFYLLLAPMRYRVNCPYNLAMTPYMLTGRLHGSNSVFLLLFLIAALVTALSGQNNQEAKAAPLHVNSQNDALTRSGFEHQYQLDYDNAIQAAKRVRMGRSSS